MGKKSLTLPFPKNQFHPLGDDAPLEHQVAVMRERGAHDEALYNVAAANYSFAVLPARAYRLIAAEGPIVDVGAGNGYVARRLAQLGADVVAIEPRDDATNPVFPTYRANHTVLGHPKLHGRTVLMVWPTNDAPENGGHSWAPSAIDLSTARTLIYVGDRDFEKTGSPRMREALHVAGYRLDFRLVVDSWPWLMRDELHIYRRPQR